jgi:hypothetical protein
MLCGAGEDERGVNGRSTSVGSDTLTTHPASTAAAYDSISLQVAASTLIYQVRRLTLRHIAERGQICFLTEHLFSRNQDAVADYPNNIRPVASPSFEPLPSFFVNSGAGSPFPQYRSMHGLLLIGEA